MRKRHHHQQHQQQQEPAGPSTLDSWVSSDSHFVPARRTPHDAAPPPSRPPLAKATSMAASILGFGCRSSSGAGDPPSRPPPGSTSDCTPAATAATPATVFPVARGGCGGGGTDAGSPSHYTAPAAAAAVVQSLARHSLGSDQGAAGRRLDGGLYAHASSSAPPPAAATPSRVAGAAGASSVAFDGLPETPSLRSPEWSPRRRSRSSGSAPSPPSPLTATLMTAAAAPLPASEPRGLSCGSYAGRSTEVRPSAVAGGSCGGDGVGPSVCPAAGTGRGGWGLGGQGSGGMSHEDSEGVWKGRGGGGGGGGGDDGGRTSRTHAQGSLAAPAPVAFSAGGVPAMAAPALLGPDTRDLSFVLGVLGAVRCAANAARGAGVSAYAGGGGGAAGCSSQPGTAGGSCGGVDAASAIRRRDKILGRDSPAYDSGSGAATRPPAGAAAAAAAADDAAAAGAILAAPTSVLVLVLALRLFRAATRWPAAASVCAAATAVLAAWLAAAAALLAAAGAAGRTAHILARIALAAATWRVAGRAVPAAAAAY